MKKTMAILLAALCLGNVFMPYKVTAAMVSGERKNSSGKWVNETVGGDYKRVKRHIKSSLRTNIYEHSSKGSDPQARLRFKKDRTDGHIFGYWSPDSTKKYTLLN